MCIGAAVTVTYPVVAMDADALALLMTTGVTIIIALVLLDVNSSGSFFSL